MLKIEPYKVVLATEPDPLKKRQVVPRRSYIRAVQNVVVAMLCHDSVLFARSPGPRFDLVFKFVFYTVNYDNILVKDDVCVTRG